MFYLIVFSNVVLEVNAPFIVRQLPVLWQLVVFILDILVELFCGLIVQVALFLRRKVRLFFF